MPQQPSRIKTTAILFLLVVLSGCSSSKDSATMSVEQEPAEEPPLHYTIAMTDTSYNLFDVTLQVDDLDDSNKIYQFASTAPGTYQVHDIGRYVRSFSAFTADGSPIATSHVSTNQWSISDPEKVSRIHYVIAETWDTPVDVHPVYLMSGTSIERDHALINGHAVVGYPTGMQARPIELTIDRDPSWITGTALETDTDGDFMADNFDHLVDSPILMGRLSRAELDVYGSTVEIYTYSKTDAVKSDEILDATRDILTAAGDFLGGLPVNRYTFLFHFEDVTMGAWEHSYSSEYILAEKHFDHAITSLIPDIVAHEFFHVVTPLNIHSEVIEQFNFVHPVASEHLWLYEGTTEWAAHMMQLRAGLITLDEYMNRISHKLTTDEQYDQTYSLSKLSLTSFEDEGHKQYGNIYMRGALVAGLLDIRLLELSGGTKGLREVLEELSETYGPDHAFDEASFFDVFTAMTYPEIGDFFDRYIKHAQPLPIAEYYGKLGISYAEEVASGDTTVTAGIGIAFNGDNFVIGKVEPHPAACGFRTGDIWSKYNDTEVTVASIQQISGEFKSLAADVPYNSTVVRDGEDRTITCTKTASVAVSYHVFTIDENPTPEQAALREAWSRNLPLQTP